jgi:type IV secretion system protein VirB5
MKNHLKAFVVSLFILSGGAKAQGIPVIDVANLMQAVNQVLAWQQQYSQMIQQIEQLQIQNATASRALESATGSRGLGLISNGITQSVVDPNFRAQLSSATDFNQVNETGRAQIQNLSQATTVRFSQIQSLMASINSTNDPKSIAELTARIQAEQAMIVNEQKEVDLVRQSLEMQIRAIDSARLQRSISANSQPVKVN